MATSQRSTQLPRLCFIIWASSVLLLVFLTQALMQTHQQHNHRPRRDVNDSTAESMDPAAIDLTPLVNTLINSSQSGSWQLFSLLSVTSHSSLALHRLTLLVYNISSISIIESNMFRRRFCYCVTNETNDLTDFTAILLDVMGNSTTYLHELFKSASILSVSQRNNSDCIYICVMAGKMDGELPELWDVDSITPLFNQTIIEGPGRAGNVSSIREPSGTNVHKLGLDFLHSYDSAASHRRRAAEWRHSHVDHRPSSARQPAPRSCARHSPTGRDPPKHRGHQTQDLSAGLESNRTPATDKYEANDPDHASHKTLTGPAHLAAQHRGQDPGDGETRGCPWRRSERSDSSISSSSTTVSAHKLQPCILELCKFFSQCLCRPLNTKTRLRRYCDDSQVWYETHTLEVCRRVRRLSFSRNLKQRCLAKMCSKV
ncbi:HERV-H LTR-associating protein 1 [Genypterus blacodes]|uniref:HERV-H LTR-associating protein 1 n=1 Tax=Genypterus blacodes TaxID=154954 RepID=UPI003F7709FF